MQFCCAYELRSSRISQSLKILHRLAERRKSEPGRPEGPAAGLGQGQRRGRAGQAEYPRAPPATVRTPCRAAAEGGRGSGRGGGGPAALAGGQGGGVRGRGRAGQCG